LLLLLVPFGVDDDAGWFDGNDADGYFGENNAMLVVISMAYSGRPMPEGTTELIG